MNEKLSILGIDACKGGWIAAKIHKVGRNQHLVINIYTSFQQLWEYEGSSNLILIDLPLRFHDDNSERDCDKASRAFIGSRRSSIFRCPSATVVDSSASQYAEVCELNFKVTEKKLSVQSVALLPKIREVRKFPPAQTAIEIGILVESHPEVSFCGLNGGKTLAHSKKVTAGIDQRLDILVSVDQKMNWKLIPEAIYSSTLQKYPRKTISRDDILDSIALAFVGLLGFQSRHHLPIAQMHPSETIHYYLMKDK